MSVNERKVRERIQQCLVLVLSVQLDVPRGEVAKRSGGGQRPVDERAAPPLAGDLAADDQFPAVGLLEDRFNRRLGLARAHQVGRGAGTEQQTDRLHQDRFAGAGLTGEDVEAGFEFHLDGLDHGEVANAEETQHLGGNPIVSDL